MGPVVGNETIYTCDMLVIGSGAAGLTAAITAKLAGLDVLVIEKADCFGGTTAVSGGYLWVPGNPMARGHGIVDTPQQAMTYLAHEAGNFFDAARAAAFVEQGPEMVQHMLDHTNVEFFLSPGFPDYHPDAPGGLAGGRSFGTVAYDGRKLGANFARMRKPLPQITFFGMFLGSGLEIQHYFNVTRSLRSALFVGKSLFRHLKDMTFHGRGVRLTQGGALVARLAKTLFDLDIPLWLDAPALSLLNQDGRITGAVTDLSGQRRVIHARHGVLLATGGFAHDGERHQRTHPSVAAGQTILTPVPESVTGDGIRLGEASGASFVATLVNPAPWVPVSRIPGKTGSEAVFPHLTDRTKPGIIAVTRDGRRFVNEADSYHDFGQAMAAACAGQAEAEAWMIADHRAIGRYGLGFAKPFPVPIAHHIRSGYLLRAPSIEALAKLAGIDPDGLAHTLATYNADAAEGRDTAFGRGGSAYNRYQGDTKHQPNPNVAPLTSGPFYAVRLLLGEIGTYCGLATDAHARVLDLEGAAIAGLYAAGADMATVTGGNYPGAGANIGPAMTFGYVAANHIAAARRPMASQEHT